MRAVAALGTVCTLLLVAGTAAASELGAAHERLKSLVGTWDVEGADRTVEYSLSGRGDTVIEEFRGEPTMASFYHMDGEGLMLTHYCSAGNQPRMKAESFDARHGVLRFGFLDVTNLASPDAYHTRELEIRFLSDDHIELAFTGKKADELMPSVLTLKKRRAH